jgi:hypothetical protein
MKPDTKSQIAQALRLLAAALESESEQPTPVAAACEYIDVKECLRRYGMGKNALAARGVPCARMGRSIKWKVADIESAIQAKPAKPRPPKKVEVDGDELDALIASGAVRR